MTLFQLCNAQYDASTLLRSPHLTYVKDSGICETTPNVHQASGYIEVRKDTFYVCTVSLYLLGLQLRELRRSGFGSLKLDTRRKLLH